MGGVGRGVVDVSGAGRRRVLASHPAGSRAQHRVLLHAPFGWEASRAAAHGLRSQVAAGDVAISARVGDRGGEAQARVGGANAAARAGGSFLGSAHDLADVHPTLARRLLDGLAETRGVGQALDMLAAGIARATRHLRDRKTVGAARAFDLVRGSSGRLPVERIASMTGVSLRHLRRAARRDSGVPLKLYGRLLRLSQAMTRPTGCRRGRRSSGHEWRSGPGTDDQPHPIRECRAITGMAPGELVRERRGEVDPDAGAS